jgi:ABC-type sugar transport system substrate-binding protein
MSNTLFRKSALVIGFALAAGASGCASTAVGGSVAIDRTTALNQVIAENPALKSQITDFQVFSGSKVSEKALVSVNSYCGLVWVQDDGAYGVMRATRSTSINVNNVRNGRVVSGGVFNLNQGDTIRLMQNRDGLNYDGYNC